MTISTHTTDRLEGRGAMRTTWKRFGAVGVSLAALAAAITTSALADTAMQRALSSQDLSVPANGPKPDQFITGISCLASTGGCTLHATTGTLNVPGGASYTIWGYGMTAGAATVPGPTIVANKGDQLTIHLVNDLTVPTSLSLAAVPLSDHTPEAQIPGGGGTADYTFTVNNSGTLTYEPGPAAPTGNRQVALGMSGTVVVRPTTCASISLGHCVYGADLPAAQSTLDIYNDEALVAVNDFDSRMLTAADPMTFSMADFSPDIHLVNGKAFPATDVIDALAGDSVLVRYVNHSPIDRTEGVLGAQQKIVGRDAHPLSHTQGLVAALLTPGQTAEAIIQVSGNAQPGDRFAIADQSRRMKLAVTDGAIKETVGALTFINVWKIGADPNQPVVTDLALTSGTITGTDDVSAGTPDLTFSFTAPSASTQQRFFIDQIGGPVETDLGAASSGTVTVAQLTSLGNGPHVIWVQSSLDGISYGDASGVAFFIDRSGPVVHDTNVNPVAVNGDVDHNSVVITSTGDTSLTGTQNVNAGFYAINPNAVAVNCATVETGTPLDADPPGAIPLAGLTQVQGFLSTADISALGEGAYNVSVIARDSLNHFSSDPSGNPVCETANAGLDAASQPYSFVIDKTGARVDHSVDATSNHADPAVTNGYTGYVANPNWEDSVYVEVQLHDIVSNQVNSNVARVEAFLEGSDGYTDAVTGVNTPFTWAEQGAGSGIYAPSDATGLVNVDGSGFEFIAADGAFDSPTEKAYALIPLATIQQLVAGPHRVFVHALDSAGNWGPTHTFAGSALEVGATITLVPDAPTITITSGSRTPTGTGNRTNVTVGFMAVAAGNQTITNIDWSIAAVGVAPSGPWTSLNASASPPVPASAPFFANEIASIVNAALTPTQTIWIRVTDNIGHQALVSIAPTVSLGNLRATQLNTGNRTATVAVNTAAVSTQTVTRIEWAWTQGGAPVAFNPVAGGAANPRNVTINATMPNTVNGTNPSTFWVQVTDSLGTRVLVSRTVPGISIAPLVSNNIPASTNRTVHAIVTGNGTVNVTAFAYRVQVGAAVPATFLPLPGTAVVVPALPSLNPTATFNTAAVPRTTRTFWSQVTDANGTQVILGRTLPAS